MTTEIEVMKHLQKELKGDVLDYTKPQERRAYIWIEPAALRKAVSTLSRRYRPRFMTLSAIDHGLDIELLYHFSVEGRVISLRTKIPKERNEIDTISDLIPAAYLIEREVNDLFGVKFRNHPRLERLILPKDWPSDSYPLRTPHKGKLPSIARLPAEKLLSTGCLPPVSSFVKRRRKKSGLPPVPPAVCSDEERLPEFQEMMKLTNFAKKAGYDWEKKKLRYK